MRTAENLRRSGDVHFCQHHADCAEDSYLWATYWPRETETGSPSSLTPCPRNLPEPSLLPSPSIVNPKHTGSQQDKLRDQKTGGFTHTTLAPTPLTPFLQGPRSPFRDGERRLRATGKKRKEKSQKPVRNGAGMPRWEPRPAPRTFHLKAKVSHLACGSWLACARRGRRV